MNFSSALMLGAQLLSPISEQVPTLSVSESCKGAAAVAMTDSQSYDACMKDENQAREQLLTSWQTFSAPNRIRCSGEASSEGIASYVELLVCLQIAQGTNIDQQNQLKGARRKK
jgi:hypothetical protein